MATFLDVTALENFSNIFVFLFVFLGSYGVTAFTTPFGQNKFVNLLISFLVGIFVLFSDLATKIVLDIMPWLVVGFVFIMIINSATKVLGVSDAAFGGMKAIILLIVVIAVIVGALAQVRENIDVPGDNETSTDFDRDFSQTITVIFHPNFLGMIFFLALSVFTVALLASRQT